MDDTNSGYIIKEFKSGDPAFEQYKSLVLATWLRGLKHGCEFFRDADSKIFFAIYSKVIMSLLRRPDCVVRIAVLHDEPDTAIGWSVFENQCMHFVYVRPQGRREGIGSNLMPKRFDTITHMTKIGRAIWKSKFKDVKFNPF